MRSLLLIAHGSRRASSNDEIRALTSRLAERVGGRFDRVGCAFLELAEPCIAAAIEEAVQEGATQVVILPYFLSAGRHVVVDIPAEVARKQDEHPQVRIHVAPYLGQADAMTEILIALAHAGANGA